jgi:hypothetical protein
MPTAGESEAAGTVRLARQEQLMHLPLLFFFSIVSADEKKLASYRPRAPPIIRRVDDPTTTGAALENLSDARPGASPSPARAATVGGCGVTALEPRTTPACLPRRGAVGVSQRAPRRGRGLRGPFPITSGHPPASCA